MGAARPTTCGPCRRPAIDPAGGEGASGSSAAVLAAVAELAAMSLSNAAVFLLVTVLAGALLWHKRLPFWARVALTLLGALGMFLTLLSGMGLL
jgi:hypothetical protein